MYGGGGEEMLVHSNAVKLSGDMHQQLFGIRVEGGQGAELFIIDI